MQALSSKGGRVFFRFAFFCPIKRKRTKGDRRSIRRFSFVSLYFVAVWTKEIEKGKLALGKITKAIF